MQKTSMKVNAGYEGVTLEKKIQKIVSNKEPITDASPLIYTDRKDGVQGDYNVRTDKWEVAVDAMDKVNQSTKAHREMRIGDKAFEGMTEEQKTEHVKTFKHSKHKDWKPQGGETTEGNQGT